MDQLRNYLITIQQNITWGIWSEWEERKGKKFNNDKNGEYRRDNSWNRRTYGCSERYDNGNGYNKNGNWNNRRNIPQDMRNQKENVGERNRRMNNG